jgi:hypothetical protein
MRVHHVALQEQARRVKDVAYNLKERIRQELAHPTVVHFYTWLLQGVRNAGAWAWVGCSYPTSGIPCTLYPACSWLRAPASAPHLRLKLASRDVLGTRHCSAPS